MSALCEIDNSKTRADCLGEIADFVPDEQLPGFWRLILDDKSALVRARLVSQEFHRMQPAFWPEAEKFATSSDDADSTDWYSKYFRNSEFVARVALLHKLTSVL